jgi:hypothetical protein
MKSIMEGVTPWTGKHTVLIVCIGDSVVGYDVLKLFSGVACGEACDFRKGGIHEANAGEEIL